MCEECLAVHNLRANQMGKMENDRLESENMFVFMNEADSGNLVLNSEPTYCSCI